MHETLGRLSILETHLRIKPDIDKQQLQLGMDSYYEKDWLLTSIPKTINREIMFVVEPIVERDGIETIDWTTTFVLTAEQLMTYFTVKPEKETV